MFTVTRRFVRQLHTARKRLALKVWRCPDGVPEESNKLMIVRWIAKQGDTVKQGDALCHVEICKATVDFYAPQAGRLATCGKEGVEFKLGETFAELEDV